jgi:hypothetical protein
MCNFDAGYDQHYYGPQVSYDYPDGYVPPPPRRRTLVDRYWSFVIWMALDAPFRWMNRWGLNRLDKAR